MSALLDLFTTVALVLGALFFLAGVVGLLRFPDTLSRLHALTKADNVGLGLIVAISRRRLTLDVDEFVELRG